MAYGHRKRKDTRQVKRGSRYPLSKLSTAEAGRRAYELKWLRSLLGLSPADAAKALEVDTFDYALWENGRTAIPPTATGRLAKAGGIDLSYIPRRDVGPPEFPPHPYPGQLAYGVKSMLAFAEHGTIDLSSITAWDYLMLVENATKPLPGYPL